MTLRLIAPGRPALLGTGRLDLTTAVTPSLGIGSPTTLTLSDFKTFTVGVQPIVQRAAGQTYANLTVPFTFTGPAPADVQARVISSSNGTVIAPWASLTGVVISGLTGSGVLTPVPQGTNYLLQIRDGLNPTNSATISNGVTPFGVGVIFLFEGQSNMVLLLGGNYTDPVPGSSLNEWAYYNSLVGTGTPGAVFDAYGWHADGGSGASFNTGPFGGSSAFAATANVPMFMRMVATALQAKYGKSIPVGIIPWAFNATGIGAFLPSNTAQLAGNSGVAGGSIGLKSSTDYFCGDFEGFLWHQGEADAGVSPATYATELQSLYQGFLTLLAPFGRGPADFYFGVDILGNYGPADEPSIETIRQGEMTFIAGARAGTLSGQASIWSNVDCGCNCIDLTTQSGLHLATDAAIRTGMRRMIQGVLKFLGASTNGPSGLPFGARGPVLNPVYSRNGLVVTFSVIHEGGTALTVPTPANPPTGFYANTAADFSGTYITPTVALVNSDTQIQLTFPTGTAFPVYVKYMGGRIGETSVYTSSLGVSYTPSCNPDFSNAIYDNVVYPSYATGSDIEALSMPMQPTNGAITVS